MQKGNTPETVRVQRREKRENSGREKDVLSNKSSVKKHRRRNEPCEREYREKKRRRKKKSEEATARELQEPI